MASVDVDGTQVSLAPGMVVTVDVKTGQRRLIDYSRSSLIIHTSETREG
ncbi:hypothetical protein [Pseudoduganella chitinolytica]|uniref:Uncharacterized protein n=1 Tax=Pseudoduganella chitinolytica TaxID=34070 RepID=A0ABY8BK35_9BURK|nr:hypothetical protein [Pseudoduganella chitinolytica]WEF35778.1 hypothetical protein PX653_13840 [Pseudoduganella chitinolytica]